MLERPFLRRDGDLHFVLYAPPRCDVWIRAEVVVDAGKGSSNELEYRSLAAVAYSLTFVCPLQIFAVEGILLSACCSILPTALAHQE